MTSGQWSFRRRILKNLPKIAQKLPKIPTNLVELCPRKIHRKFETYPCFGLREVKNVILHSDRHVNIHVT